MGIRTKTGGCSLPGGSPVMSCAVQQGAHISLVSPCNIDHQHACERRKQRGHLFCVNSDNSKTNRNIFHVSKMCAVAAA